MKKYNFNPGPAKLPRVVIENTAKAVLDLNNSGLSIMEVSHRSKDFEGILGETITLFKELYYIPANYHILFLGGGANLQFCIVPMNLLNKKAAYLETGHWAERAIKEARFYGEVEIVASSKDKNFSYIPKNFNVPDDADYFHFTTNNTIYGTEIFTDYDVKVPLIADMSSNIFSRKVDISKYSLIYAGAQKNLGPAGVTVVIIKDSILGKIERKLPAMLNYQTHVKDNSLYNTPPCTAIFTVKEMLLWAKNLGGLEKIEEINRAKAELLYDAIDNSKIFIGTVNKEDRSRMNVCFVMKPEYKDKEEEFAKFASTKGIIGIKGHRSVGGFRASLYNAVDKDDVQTLVNAMKEFEIAVVGKSAMVEK